MLRIEPAEKLLSRPFGLPFSPFRPPGEYRGVAPLHSPHSPPWGSGAGGGLRPKPAPPPQGWGHSKPVKGRFTRPLARVLAALRAAPCDRSPLTASPFRKKDLQERSDLGAGGNWRTARGCPSDRLRAVGRPVIPGAGVALSRSRAGHAVDLAPDHSFALGALAIEGTGNHFTAFSIVSGSWPTTADGVLSCLHPKINKGATAAPSLYMQRLLIGI